MSLEGEHEVDEADEVTITAKQAPGGKVQIAYPGMVQLVGMDDLRHAAEGTRKTVENVAQIIAEDAANTAWVAAYKAAKSLIATCAEQTADTDSKEADDG